jgi:hypothetical protein
MFQNNPPTSPGIFSKKPSHLHDCVLVAPSSLAAQDMFPFMFIHKLSQITPIVLDAGSMTLGRFPLFCLLSAITMLDTLYVQLYGF